MDACERETPKRGLHELHQVGLEVWVIFKMPRIGSIMLRRITRAGAALSCSLAHAAFLGPSLSRKSAKYAIDPHSFLSALSNLDFLPSPVFTPEQFTRPRRRVMSSSQVQGTGYTEDDLKRIREAYAQASNSGDQVIENPVASPKNRLTTISVACIIANRMIGDLIHIYQWVPLLTYCRYWRF